MATALPPSVTDAVRNLNGTRRFVALAIMAGALALLWVASRWATRPTMVTLYRDLELSAAGEVTAALAKASIPYDLAGGGTEVRVPVKEQARARVLLAQDGLPTSGTPGWQLFDEMPLGETEARERIRYRRALEGELSRQVSEVRGVERAVVRLTPPETSPLRRSDRPAKASVMLRLRPGAALGAAEVQGIAYLVANSMEQLTVENVAIMDDAGRMLSAPADAGAGFGQTARQSELRHGVEGELAAKVEAILASQFRDDQARVQVTADLDFAQVERTVENFDPDRQVLQSEQREEAEADPELGSGQRTVYRNDYQNSRETARIIEAVGAVKRLNVAVLLDARVLPADTAQGGALLAAQLAKLDSLTRSAVGFDSARGDRVTIMAMPFAADPTTAFDAAAAAQDSAQATGATPLELAERFAAPAVLLLGVLLAFVVAMRVLKGGAPAAPALAAGAPAAQGAAALAAPPPLDLPPIVPSQSLQLRNAVQADSANRPETAAAVMRAWMGER